MRSPDAAVVRRAPLHPLLAKELREIVSGRALWTMLLILCPLVGYSFWQAVVALRRGERGGARCARACERALAARRRAGPDLRRALRRRDPAVSVRGHSQPRPRKGNRRAASAGAVALSGADADRGQDGGDLRRLAGRAHSSGLGRGDLGHARRASLCPGDRQSAFRTSALRLAGRRHCAVCGEHFRKLGDGGDHRAGLHHRLLGSGFRLGRPTGRARVDFALVADADAAHLRAGTSVAGSSPGCHGRDLRLCRAVRGVAASRGAAAHQGHAFDRLRGRRCRRACTGHADQDIGRPHRGSAQLVSSRRSAGARRASRAAARHRSSGAGRPALCRSASQRSGQARAGASRRHHSPRHDRPKRRGQQQRRGLWRDRVFLCGPRRQEPLDQPARNPAAALCACGKADTASGHRAKTIRATPWSPTDDGPCRGSSAASRC